MKNIRDITKFKKLIAIMAMMVAALVLTGCTTLDNFNAEFFGDGQKEETIVIGVYEPETGADAQYGKEEIQGIQLAYDMYPEVLGKKIEIVYEDTQSSIYTTESAIQELINYQPDLILGCYGEANALLAAKYIEQKLIPTIGISNKNDLITKNYHYYASVTYNDTVQGKALGNYVSKEYAGKKVAIFRQAEDDSTDEVTNRFIKSATVDQKHKVKVATKEYYQVGTTDFTENIQNILKANVDAVFCPIGTEAADQLFTQIEKQNLTYITFIGTSLWDNDDFTKMMSKHPRIRILMSSGLVSSKKEDEKSENFLKAYQEKFGKDQVPTENVALAYDAYVLAIQSIEKAGTVSGPKVMNEILKTEGFPGITGDITLDDNGRAKKPIQLSTIIGGKVVSLGEINQKQSHKDKAKDSKKKDKKHKKHKKKKKKD